MAGLLDDLHTVDKAGGLTLHLEAHGLLDRLQGVDVLRLGTGTELGGSDRTQREVGIHTHRALVHADIGDAEGLDQLTQGGHVGAGDLRSAGTCALDRLGHDLNERDAGTVGVHQGGGGASDAAAGATEVGQLGGVLLHVGALDLDTPRGAVVEDDVEVAVVGDGLVVLGDLVVLRLVRVEVVLPGEAGVRGDLAVEGQADLDGPLHTLAVDHGQGARQTQAHRVDVAVRVVAELRGRGREHLRLRQQLDVDLHTHHGVEALQHLVVVHHIIGVIVHRGSHGHLL